ncbi:MAG: hypothetical protein JW797_16035 [Bradymonadales bacterium]|nr:hypothetical protein [Bradymonadales bacterium]
MSDSKYSRREMLWLSGKAAVAVGGGIITARLLPGCGDDETGTSGDMDLSDTDDTGYQSTSQQSIFSRGYASAE